MRIPTTCIYTAPGPGAPMCLRQRHKAFARFQVGRQHSPPHALLLPGSFTPRARSGVESPRVRVYGAVVLRAHGVSHHLREQHAATLASCPAVSLRCPRRLDCRTTPTFPPSLPPLCHCIVRRVSPPPRLACCVTRAVQSSCGEQSPSTPSTRRVCAPYDAPSPPHRIRHRHCHRRRLQVGS